MKKRLLIIAGIISLSFAVFGQGPAMHFNNTHHDFGAIKEDDGPATYRYIFLNTGTSNLIITNVHPSCGCTTSNWSKDSIAAGKEGFVDATYNVEHRPGAFYRSLTIYTNTEERVSTLTFSGSVIPHVKSLNDSFPYESGNIRFENNHINYTHVTNNLTDTAQAIFMLNTSDRPILVRSINTKGAPYIRVNDLPLTIPPNGKAALMLHYNVSQVKDYGIRYDDVSLITTDEKLPEKRITVLADIHQYFPNMTDEERARSARIFFPQNKHDFGDVKLGDVVNTEFAFTNKGKTALEIYKVKTSCGCTLAEAGKIKLKPGESSVIKVSFNSTGQNGKDEKSITIYSNDPMNPVYTLKIISNVSLKGVTTGAKQ